MNMQNLMAQAQKMQRDITKKKEEVENTIFEGKSEWVELKMNGKKELQSIKITNEGPLDKEDIEMLEDMIKIALNDAATKIDKEFENKMGSYGAAFNGMF